MPFEDTEAVFRKCCGGLQNRLRRVPDGETGERNYFVQFQAAWFMAAPEMIPDFKMNSALVSKDYTPEQVHAAIEKIKNSSMETGYDEHAIASYAIFKKLREEGVIPRGIKFQVSIPTHINAMLGFVQTAFQPAVEPLYKESIFRAMRKIQDNIPHEDLAIQIDVASEYFFMENMQMFRPWFYNDDKDFDKRKEYMYDYIIEQIRQVDQDVELGLHNCYGMMALCGMP